MDRPDAGSLWMGRPPAPEITVKGADHAGWQGMYGGCSELADLWQAIEPWRTTYPGDPNDDGFLDIRDYLYINTDGCP